MTPKASPVAGVPDGTATNPEGYEQPFPVTGITEELREPYALTRRAVAADTHTGHNNVPQQKAFALRRLNEQIEHLLGSRQEQREGVGTTVASLTRSLLTMLTPKFATDVQTYLPFPDAVRTPFDSFCNKTLENFAIGDLTKMIASCFAATRQKVDLMGVVGGDLALKMGQWVFQDPVASGKFPVSIRKADKNSTVDMIVDVFKVNLGTITNVPSMHLCWNLATAKPDDTLTMGAGVWFKPELFGLRDFQRLSHTERPDTDGRGKGGFWARDLAPFYRNPLNAMLYLPGVTAVRPSEASGSGG